MGGKNLILPFFRTKTILKQGHQGHVVGTHVHLQLEHQSALPLLSRRGVDISGTTSPVSKMHGG